MSTYTLLKTVQCLQQTLCLVDPSRPCWQCSYITVGCSDAAEQYLEAQLKYGISVLKEMEIVYQVYNNVDVPIVIRSNGIDVQT